MHYVPRLGDGHQSIVGTARPLCDATRDGMGVSPSPLGAENFRPKNPPKNFQGEGTLEYCEPTFRAYF